MVEMDKLKLVNPCRQGVLLSVYITQKTKKKFDQFSVGKAPKYILVDEALKHYMNVNEYKAKGK